MFEAAEIKHDIDKAAFKRQEPRLREALLQAQFELGDKKPFEVVVLIAGLAGAGKGEALATFNDWMDPRHVETTACDPPTDEERERPYMWRFWRALPQKGRIGLFAHSWYHGPLAARIAGKMSRPDLDQRLAEIRRFERMLADEGALVVKFWLHLSEKQQRRRFEKLESSKATRWRVTKDDWKEHRDYATVVRDWGHAIRLTNEAHAPWTIVAAADPQFRALTLARTLADAIQKRLAGPRRIVTLTAPPPLPPVDGKRLLDAVEQGPKLGAEEYKERLGVLDGRLYKLSRRKAFKHRAAVVVFEGPDAAGKGGAIRRIARGMDPRFYRIVPIAAPTDEERAHPYLWRFWRHLPRRGHVTIFDRSWYGRVLVERVEGFADPDDWMRAYSEINDFEEDMARHGIVLVKFWLAIGQDEQLRRFKEREGTPFKRYKIGADDWRNRKKWNAYAGAANDMFERTSTGLAPWIIVPAEDKRHARIRTLEHLCERIEAALE
ncbi:MAG: polyphosphate:AMP phosphotransferase [Rhodospirillaceae bacterium]|nr:polyphosphate:AMP phosphotransferase [Rhodospirillaceae bacterium]